MYSRLHLRVAVCRPAVPIVHGTDPPSEWFLERSRVARRSPHVHAAEESEINSLVRTIRSGRRAALAELYQRTGRRVFELANAFLNCAEDAEEVVDDVYLYVWEQSERYDPRRGSVMKWLKGVTRNKAIDRYRLRHRCVSFEKNQQEKAARCDTEGSPAADHDLVQRHACLELHHALRLLPSHRRRLLGLAFFRGMSHQEIAGELRMPLGSVKSHIRRALNTLKIQLERSCP